MPSSAGKKKSRRPSPRSRRGPRPAPSARDAGGGWTRSSAPLRHPTPALATDTAHPLASSPTTVPQTHMFPATPPTEIYTLSLHDALPISFSNPRADVCAPADASPLYSNSAQDSTPSSRSEEHTSELQSPDHLVCRLLLAKKKVDGHLRARDEGPGPLPPRVTPAVVGRDRRPPSATPRLRSPRIRHTPSRARPPPSRRLICFLRPRPPRSTLFPYTTLFRSHSRTHARTCARQRTHRRSTRTRRRIQPRVQDRKSTRLNSSHQIISYAVFCWQKKK